MSVVPSTAGDHVIAERFAKTAPVLIARGNAVKIDVLGYAIQLCESPTEGGRPAHMNRPTIELCLPML